MCESNLLKESIDEIKRKEKVILKESIHNIKMKRKWKESIL